MNKIILSQYTEWCKNSLSVVDMSFDSDAECKNILISSDMGSGGGGNTNKCDSMIPKNIVPAYSQPEIGSEVYQNKTAIFITDTLKL